MTRGVKKIKTSLSKSVCTVNSKCHTTLPKTKWQNVQGAKGGSIKNANRSLRKFLNLPDFDGGEKLVRWETYQSPLIPQIPSKPKFFNYLRITEFVCVKLLSCVAINSGINRALLLQLKAYKE